MKLCHFTELLSAVVKIPWHYVIFHDFSMTFHDQGHPVWDIDSALTKYK